MRGFRIGFIFALSFLIIWTAACLTMVFFKAPQGPKMPEYPHYPSSNPTYQSAPSAGVTQSIAGKIVQMQQAMPVTPVTPSQDYMYGSSGSALMPVVTPTPYDPYYQDPSQVEYQKKIDQYNKDMEAYQKEQKSFTNEKIVPYLKKVMIMWIAVLVVIELIALALVKLGASLTGSAFAFTGVWAVVFGPISGGVFLVSMLATAYTSRAGTEQPDLNSIYHAAGIAGVVGVLVLTIAGILYEGVFKRRSMPHASSSQM